MVQSDLFWIYANKAVCVVAASGEEACGGGSGSSKGGSRKEYGAGSAAPSPSPGGGSHSSLHDDYDASPSSWPRPPSSPVSLATRYSTLHTHHDTRVFVQLGPPAITCNLVSDQFALVDKFPKYFCREDTSFLLLFWLIPTAKITPIKFQIF